MEVIRAIVLKIGTISSKFKWYITQQIIIRCSCNFTIMWHALRHDNVLNIKKIGSIFVSKYQHEKQLTIILENQWIWYNTLSGCSWYSFEDERVKTSDVNLLQYKSSSRKSRLLTLWINMCKLYYYYNHCLLVWFRGCCVDEVRDGAIYTELYLKV